MYDDGGADVYVENADEAEDGAGGAKKEDGANDEIFCKGRRECIEGWKGVGFSC